MLIGMRNAMMAGGAKLSAKSYIQDGLVAMWDGIENAGWGVHEQRMTSWRDLCGSDKQFVVYGGGDIVFGDLFLAHQTTGFMPYSSTAGSLLSKNSDFTVEVVSRVGALGGELFIFSTGYRSRAYGVGVVPAKTNENFLLFNAANNSVNSPNAVGDDVSYAISYESSSGLCWKNGTYVRAASGSGSSFSRFELGFTADVSASDKSPNQRTYAIRIYSRALTAAEIAANYAVDKARFNLT